MHFIVFFCKSLRVKYFRSKKKPHLREKLASGNSQKLAHSLGKRKKISNIRYVFYSKRFLFLLASILLLEIIFSIFFSLLMDKTKNTVYVQNSHIGLPLVDVRNCLNIEDTNFPNIDLQNT